ncbi:MAG: hypothetical protein N2645_09675 [Clostridia bacterium]|nr:hypothetical protein [Clostridia bacterium]
MFKKLFSIFLVIAMSLCFVLTAYAADPEFINITRPEANESTFKTSYIFCGNTDQEGIKVELKYKDKETDKWEPLVTTDGDSSWIIGSSGIFIKEVKLPYKGSNNENKIMIKAYKASNPDGPKQIKEFTITVLDETFKEKIKNKLNSIGEALSRLFK